MAMERDMTKGNPARILLLFTIPIFIGNVFQQLYSMVDTVIVGKFVGTNALAAVGATGTVIFLILGFLMGFSTGITVITSQRFGAGDIEGMKKSVGNAANKIEQLATQAFVALGAGIATYSAQNMGAGRLDRVKKGALTGTIIGCSYAVVVTTVLVLFGKNLTGLFISENLEEITGLVDVYLKSVVIFFVPLNFIFVYRNALQGMGYGLMPVLGGAAELVSRSIVAVIGAMIGSYMLVCFSVAAAWITSGAFLFIAYLVIMRRIEKEAGK